jgi:hypothetical protein
MAFRYSSGEVTCPLLHEAREYANETSFLVGNDWRKCLRMEILPPAVDAVGLSSDGLRMVATSNVRTGEPYVPFYEDMFRAVQDGAGDESVLKFLTNVEDRTGDDKSLILAVRGTGNA